MLTSYEASPAGDSHGTGIRCEGKRELIKEKGERG